MIRPILGLLMFVFIVLYLPVTIFVPALAAGLVWVLFAYYRTQAQ